MTDGKCVLSVAEADLLNFDPKLLIMAVTPTTQIALGFKAPEFELPNVVDGRLKSYRDLQGENATVVIFMCNHCPFVVHVIDQIVKIANDYSNKGVKLISISSNDVVNYPQDGPDQMVHFARDNKFSFPYLYDESQDVARAYDAACTPDISVFNSEDLCVYRGQMDGARPSNDKPNDGADLRQVLDTLLAGKSVAAEGQMPSIGCNIKWK
jgi:peroxiredoxin